MGEGGRKMRGIGIGLSDFKELITEKSFYVDKTKFIEDIVKDITKVQLITRPRRFGKTLNMSMLKYFFDIENKENNRKLFEGLYIENSSVIEEQGKYPVIFLSFKDIKADNVEKMFVCIKAVISDLFEKYKYIRESLDEET